MRATGAREKSLTEKLMSATTDLYGGDLTYGICHSVQQTQHCGFQLRDGGKELHGHAFQTKMELELRQAGGVVFSEQSDVLLYGLTEHASQLVAQQSVHTLVELGVGLALFGEAHQRDRALLNVEHAYHMWVPAGNQLLLSMFTGILNQQCPEVVNINWALRPTAVNNSKLGVGRS